jgi:hypothetical protein
MSNPIHGNALRSQPPSLGRSNNHTENTHPVTQHGIFDNKRLNQITKDYTLREPTPDKPGLIIDSHQSKHSNWISHYPGKRGSKFPKNFTRDDVCSLVEYIVDHSLSPLNELNPQNKIPKIIVYEIPKKLEGTSKSLFKKIEEIQHIFIVASYSDKYWLLHVYPDHQKSKAHKH